MDPKKLLGNLPFITKEGYFDPAQFPIGNVLKQALSDDFSPCPTRRSRNQQIGGRSPLLQGTSAHCRSRLRPAIPRCAHWP